jgi:uncharacterized membrane protein
MLRLIRNILNGLVCLFVLLIFGLAAPMIRAYRSAVATEKKPGGAASGALISQTPMDQMLRLNRNILIGLVCLFVLLIFGLAVAVIWSYRHTLTTEQRPSGAAIGALALKTSRAATPVPITGVTFVASGTSNLVLPDSTVGTMPGAPIAIPADGLELKQRWIAGKKYFHTIQSTQTIIMGMSGNKINQSIATSMELSEAIRAREDGKGKRMTLKYERLAMEMSLSGQKIGGFDSSKPGEGHDPFGMSKTVGNAAGKELQILLNENGEITGFENYDEFVKQLDRSPAPVAGMPKFVKQLDLSPVPGAEMPRRFTRQSITWTLKGLGLPALPGHPVKQGDQWPYGASLEDPFQGKTLISGNYTLSGMAEYAGTPCAEIVADGKISLEVGASLAQLGIKIEGGSLKGTLWFDPSLGRVRMSQITEQSTTTMTNPGNPAETTSVSTREDTDTKLTKIEDLK